MPSPIPQTCQLCQRRVNFRYCAITCADCLASFTMMSKPYSGCPHYKQPERPIKLLK